MSDYKYMPINWEDEPSRKTPLKASNLNHMEEGIQKTYESIQLVNENKLDKTTIGNQLYGTDGNGQQKTYNFTYQPVALTIPNRGFNGELLVPLEPIGNNEAASKQYVDTQTSNVITESGNKFVSKSTLANSVYCVDSSGNQTNYLFTYDPVAYTFPNRGDHGELSVPLEPRNNNEAISKQYVDTRVATKQDKITSTNKLDYSLIENSPTVYDATLTIQKNGTSVGTFTSNASTNKSINITVPTKCSELTNDTSFANTIYVNNQVATKQDKLVSGTNIKTIGGIDVLGSGNIDVLVSVDNATSTTSTNPVQNKVITTAVNNKQDTLVSGSNIKTVGGTSLLGSGDIDIASATSQTFTLTTTGGGTITLDLANCNYAKVFFYPTQITTSNHTITVLGATFSYNGSTIAAEREFIKVDDDRWIYITRIYNSSGGVSTSATTILSSTADASNISYTASTYYSPPGTVVGRATLIK